MRSLSLIAAAALAIACSSDSDLGTVMPDFRLDDLNPASATSGTKVSPRDHLGHISGWYFAHAT